MKSKLFYALFSISLGLIFIFGFKTIQDSSKEISSLKSKNKELSRTLEKTKTKSQEVELSSIEEIESLKSKIKNLEPTCTVSSKEAKTDSRENVVTLLYS